MTAKKNWIVVLKGRPPEEILGVSIMAALVLITLSNVVVRYFTNGSFAWTEEISVFLLVLMTLAGAALVARDDAHIRIDYFYRSSSGMRSSRLAVVSALGTAILFGLLAILLVRAGWDEFELGETTTGLGIPRWWYTAWMPLLAVLVAVRALFALRQRSDKEASAETGESS